MMPKLLVTMQWSLLDARESCSTVLWHPSFSLVAEEGKRPRKSPAQRAAPSTAAKATDKKDVSSIKVTSHFIVSTAPAVLVELSDIKLLHANLTPRSTRL